MGVYQEHTEKQNKSKNDLKIVGKWQKDIKSISHSEDREIQSHQRTDIVLKS